MNCIICPIETCENRGKDREVFCQTGEYAIRPNLVKELKWEDYRREAAKDMVVGMLAHATRYHPRNPKETNWHKAIVEEGIELADELIKQLKEEKK
jgi:hypothetical protein